MSLCKLTDYEQYIYNLTLTGDENVIGIGRIEAKNKETPGLNQSLIKKALYYMFKRHPLFRAIIKKSTCGFNRKRIFAGKIHEKSR